ncbi:MAG: hypothetical protein Q9195_005051 [Heterodermia aff. obscurata]
MTAIASHSPLETFLLFETLGYYDGEPPSFNILSESLRGHEALRERDNGNNGHLEPEALKRLYLGVIKEESSLAASRAKHDNVASDGANGGLQKSPPPVQGIATEEAGQHKHLLPQLLNRLYYQYRNSAIREIEEEERRYRTLKGDIEDLQRKEHQSQVQQEAAVVPVPRDSRSVSSIQHLLQHDPVGGEQISNEKDQTAQSPRQLTTETQASEDTSEDKAKPPVLNGNGAPATASPTPVATIVPTDPRTYPQPTVAESPSFYAAPHQPAQPHAVVSPNSDMARRPTIPSNQPRPNPVPSPTHRLSQPPLPTPERGPPTSPIILPPPKGMRHTGSPPGALEALADMAGQQYRGRPPLPSPRSTQATVAQQAPQYSQQHHTYSPRSYPYYEGQPAYANAYSPYSQSQGPPYPPANHQVYSPYPAPIANPGSHPPYPNIPYPPYPQYSSYGYTAQYPQTPRPAAFGPPSYPASAQQTPSASSSKQRPPRPSPIVTSASSTKWKNIEPGSIKTIASPTRPSRDEISPISDRAPSPPPLPPSSKEPAAIPINKKRDKNPKRTAAKERAARQGSTISRPSGRRGSTTSRPSTRSESIKSPTINEGSTDVITSNRLVKNEPPATPAADTADESASVLSTTADETLGARKSTRRRRETMRGLELNEAIRNSTATKRKRTGTSADSPTSTPAAQDITTEPKPTEKYVGGTRNFPRTSATIISEITSHKLAGMFARPLTEREAPGYKDLIYRPQDLKSIKSAVTAGNRALVAADSSGENSVELAAKADVIPPKGIVNSAQLEKEVMRMFANAIMFNPDAKRGFGASFEKKDARHIPQRLDDDEADELGEHKEDGGERRRDEDGGVVGDTREMFEAVERSVENWRAAEDWVGASGTPARGISTKVEGRLRGGEDVEASEVVEEETPEVQAEAPTVAGRRKRR